MKVFACDNEACKIRMANPDIVVTGFHPNIGGILLPDRFKESHFCSRKCFLSWMQWALSKESERSEERG